MKKHSVFILFILLVTSANAQIIVNPNFAITSHPMVVNQIVTSEGYLMIELSIENKIDNGSFCADKNIYIRNLTGSEMIKLSNSEGIPVCPDVYQFKWIGEKLTFKLYFPNPNQPLKYIDLIEDCDNACFSILGIILDSEMNNLLESAFKLFDDSDYEASEKTFKKLITENPDYPYGFLHFNLIQVLIVEEKFEEAIRYKQIIEQSNFADKVFILDQLKKTKLFVN